MMAGYLAQEPSIFGALFDMDSSAFSDWAVSALLYVSRSQCGQHPFGDMLLEYEKDTLLRGAENKKVHQNTVLYVYAQAC